MEEHCVAANYTSKDYPGGSQHPHEVGTHIWMAQSRLSVGQDPFGVVRKRGLGLQKKKLSAGRGQARLRNLFDDECETLGRTQAEHWKLARSNNE